MDSDDSDDAVVYLEHDSVCTEDGKALRRKLSSFSEVSEPFKTSNFHAPKFQRTSVPDVSVPKNKQNRPDIIDISPDHNESPKDLSFNFGSYTRQQISKVSFNPAPGTVSKHSDRPTPSQHRLKTSSRQEESVSMVQDLLGLSPLPAPSQRNCSIGSRPPVTGRPNTNRVEKRKSMGVIDGLTDRPAHWGGGAVLSTSRGASSRTSSGPGGSSRRKSTGNVNGKGTVSSSASRLSSRRSSLPLAVAQRVVSGKPQTGKALSVSFQPSFLTSKTSAAACRKEVEESVEDVCADDEAEGRNRVSGYVMDEEGSMHYDNSLSTSRGADQLLDSPVHVYTTTSGSSLGGYQRGQQSAHDMSPPDSASPSSRTSRYRSSGPSSSSLFKGKLRKGSLSHQLKSLLKESDSMDVRFSTAREQWAPVRMRMAREVLSGGEEDGRVQEEWTEVGEATRDRDLQDPRNRSSRWVDVQVLARPGSQSSVGDFQGIFVVKMLQVRAIGAPKRRTRPQCNHSSMSTGGGVGWNESINRLEMDFEMADASSTVEGKERSEMCVGDVVYGYFRKDTSRAMGVSLELGAALRIHNYVYVACAPTSESGEGIEHGMISGGKLLCTHLCERVELL